MSNVDENLVKFYMQACTKDGDLIQDTLKDLEVDFVGLRYLKATGINDLGKVVNVYTESYSDSNKLRTWHPSENDLPIVREATKITLELLFYGDNRVDSYNSFNEFIYGGYRCFWDTLRKKKFIFTVIDAAKPSEDNLIGVPFIKCSWTLQNLYGKTDNI
jgi:hypothetical protein